MGTMRTLGMALLVALVLPAASCESGLSCTDIFFYGLTVTIRDDATNQPICDATVSAVDGAYSEQLVPQSIGTSDCTYAGAGERAGTYTLTAKKSGYQDTVQAGNVVNADACHVRGITVALRMRK